MALTILHAGSTGLCLGITATTANRVTMQPELGADGALHFRILGLPAPYNTAPPLWAAFGHNLHIVRQATAAQTVDVVFRRWSQYVVAGQITVESGADRCDWYGDNAFALATFTGDAQGPRPTWEEEENELTHRTPPPNYSFAYVEMQNTAHVDFLAVRLRRAGVAPGQTATTHLKFLRLADYGVVHRDPKVVITTKTTPPTASNC
jgi:hypothetical protein